MTLEAEKVPCSPSKVPFNMDQLQPDLYQLWDLRNELWVWEFQKDPSN